MGHSLLALAALAAVAIASPASIAITFHGSAKSVRDFSLTAPAAGVPVPIPVLPRWHGQDFSVVPQFSVQGPFMRLPEGRFILPRLFPLPRDLDRDFDP